MIWCHWEIPAWPWHNHTQQIYPLKPSPRHWRGLLSDQQQIQKCITLKTALPGRSEPPIRCRAPGRKSHRLSLFQYPWRSFPGSSGYGDLLCSQVLHLSSCPPAKPEPVPSASPFPVMQSSVFIKSGWTPANFVKLNSCLLGEMCPPVGVC